MLLMCAFFYLNQVFINRGSNFAIGIPILGLTRLLGTIIQILFLSNKGFCLSIKPWYTHVSDFSLSEFYVGHSFP